MRKFILGTDWWTDCDDAVALRLITNAMKGGDIELLGVGINACMEYSVASVKAFFKAEGINYNSIGIDFNATDFGGKPSYQKRLAESFCPDICNTDAEDAVRLYRKLLCSGKDKIEIIEMGYPQVIANVLKSGADDISDKTGVELISQKVSKIWMMAGKWDGNGQKENNFCRNMRSRIAGRDFCELCPVPVSFLGWEIGHGVITGKNLSPNDHLYHILLDHGSKNGRHSWDPMLVYMALLGNEEEAGYRIVKGKASVDAQTGANYFEFDENGKHTFVIKKFDNAYYENQINRLL